MSETPTDTATTATTVADKIREIAERVAEAVETLLRGPAPAPAFVPVRHRPTPEELRRYAQQRRRY